ncbi:MAG: hypothetical protein ACM3VT_04430, partial [Solirubrobacterales bacterium]
RILEIDPQNPEALYHMALALATLGQMEPALLHYSKAVKGDPNVDTSPSLHHLLANNYYMQKGQYQEALRHEDHALALAQAQGDAQLTAAIKQAIENCRKLAQATGR